MKLYSFFRGGTSHRLRIALNFKGLPYDYETVDLRREQHLGAAYKAVHPQGLVPALQTDGDDGQQPGEREAQRQQHERRGPGGEAGRHHRLGPEAVCRP